MGLSPTEIFFIMLAVLLVLGPKKIPEIARSLGSLVRTFQGATNDLKREVWSSAQDFKNPVDDIKGEIAKVEQKVKNEVDEMINLEPLDDDSSSENEPDDHGLSGSIPRK